MKFISILSLLTFSHHEQGDLQDRLGVFGMNKPEAAKELRVEWTRLQLPWYRFEPQKGKYNFKQSDKFLRQMGDVNLFLTLKSVQKTEKNMHFGDYRVGSFPDDIERWKQMIRKFISRYKGIVKVYQIENEIVSKGFWADSLDDYIRFVQITSQVIKDEDPGVKVALAGFPGGIPYKNGKIDEQEVEKIKKIFGKLVTETEDYVDLIDFHLYNDYRLIDYRISFIRELTSKPIWCTECAGPDIRDYEGASQFEAVLDESKRHGTKAYGDRKRFEELLRKINPNSIFLSENADQFYSIEADEIIRRILVGLTAGIEKVFITHFREGLGVVPLFDKFGIVTAYGGKKPAYYALQFLAEQFRGSDSLKREEFSKDIWAFSFTREKETIYVLWSDKGGKHFTLNIKGSKAILIKDWKTDSPSEKPLDIDNGKIRLSFDESPVFVKVLD